MGTELKFILSLLRFIAEQAPHLVEEVGRLVSAWATKKGVPVGPLQAALDRVDPSVAAVDAEVDQYIADNWDEPTRPDRK